MKLNFSIIAANVFLSFVAQAVTNDTCLEIDPSNQSNSKPCIIGSITVRIDSNTKGPALFTCKNSVMGGTTYSPGVNSSAIAQVFKKNKDNPDVLNALKAINSTYAEALEFFEDPKARAEGKFETNFFSDDVQDTEALKKLAILYNQSTNQCSYIESLAGKIKRDADQQLADARFKVKIDLDEIKKLADYNQDHALALANSCKDRPNGDPKPKAIQFDFEEGPPQKNFPMNMFKNSDGSWTIDLKSGNEVISRKVFKNRSGVYVYVSREGKELPVNIFEIAASTVNRSGPLGYSGNLVCISFGNNEADPAKRTRRNGASD